MRTAALINHFGNRYRHSIVAMDGNRACAERIAPGIAVYFPWVDIRKGDTRGNRARFRAFLHTNTPDALLTSNWGSIEWAMANFPGVVRHIHTEDGFGPEERNRQIGCRVWTRRLLLRRCEVVLPSRTLLTIARDTWRLPASRLHYIPNGIDLRRFAAVPDRQMLADWPGQGLVIGTVAALRPEKNLARLIRAFALLRQRLDVRLVIVGDGPERSALAQLAQTLGVAVHFTGHMTNPRAAIGCFDLFALSSDTEQMPLSVLEAMAGSLAVASTDVGDVRQMLAPANHPFVAGGDDAVLATSLYSLLADDRLRRDVGAANLVRVATDFDETRMFAAYGSLWDGA